MRILFALELGGNWGHLARDLPIATELRRRGNEVRFAVPDCHKAAPFLRPKGFDFTPGCVPSVPVRAHTPPANYAEILLGLGYARPGALRVMVRSWQAHFDEFRPDVIVTDFAPAAMLAARLTARPQVAVGLGYDLPPPIHPLPSIRPWEPVSTTRLLNSNAVVTAFGGTPLNCLHELLTAGPVLLTTVPELDHFGPRTDGLYLGPIYSTPEPAITAHWPPDLSPRVLAYLHRQTDGLDALLGALSDAGTAIACIPGKYPSNGKSNGRIQIFTAALHLEPLLLSSDLVITNGNLTTSARALLAGVPVLSLPHVVEQRLGALRIASLGAGLTAGDVRSLEALRSLLDRLRSKDAYRNSARQFAARYSGHTSVAAAARASEYIEAIAG
jgi:UDP:flavonoid glycosyltransferase YjiC (YdhE family)